MSHPRNQEARTYPDLTVSLSRRDLDLVISALGKYQRGPAAALRVRLAQIRSSQSLYEAARARLQAQCAQLGLLLAPWQLDIVAQAVVRDAERWQIPKDLGDPDNWEAGA
ncbi:hypothetical protein SEA_PUPPERS_54 [Gordonia phage Puppers]|nr:hypothetical protein SEA_PUPPERS_54 [Gordonia phage Puppers]